jgi:hypothetical protein
MAIHAGHMVTRPIPEGAVDRGVLADVSETSARGSVLPRL